MLAKLEPGNIGAYGTRGMNPGTWGHELIHKEMGIRDESPLRLLEAYNARDKQEWDAYVKRHAEYNGISLFDAERELVRQFSWLEKNDSQMHPARREYKAGARLTDAPMESGAWMWPKESEPRESYVQQRNKQSYLGRNYRSLSKALREEGKAIDAENERNAGIIRGLRKARDVITRGNQ